MKEKLVILMFTLLPHHLISRGVGLLANCKVSWVKNSFIRWYIRHYQVDMSESKLKNPEEFVDFNAFFTRELSEGSRPIEAERNIVICPVDGTISELGAIDEGKLLQAKGEYYTLEALLGDKNDAVPFHNGMFATLYLAPKDYHRIHMPIKGSLVKMTYIPGRLFSVNPTSVNLIEGLFARNERVVAYFETDRGMLAVVLVGAMIVASISTKWAGTVVPNTHGTIQTWVYNKSESITLDKGDELGAFALGSTVILLFEQPSLLWCDDMSSNKVIKMGQSLARCSEKA